MDHQISPTSLITPPIPVSSSTSAPPIPVSSSTSIPHIPVAGTTSIPPIPVSDVTSVPPIPSTTKSILDGEPNLSAPSSDNEAPENISDEANTALDHHNSLPDIDPGFDDDNNYYGGDDDADDFDIFEQDQPAHIFEDDDHRDPEYITDAEDEPGGVEDEANVDIESEVEARAGDESEDEPMNDLAGETTQLEKHVTKSKAKPARKPKNLTKSLRATKPKKVKISKTPKMTVPKQKKPKKQKPPKPPKVPKPPKPPREKKAPPLLRPVNPERPKILRTNRLDFMFHAIEQYLPDKNPIQMKPEVLSRLYKPPKFKIFEEYDHHEHVYTPPASPVPAPVSLKSIAESGNHNEDQEENKETQDKDDDVTMVSKEEVPNNNNRPMLSPEAAKRQAINLDQFFFDFTVQLYKKCCSDEVDPCWFLHELEYNYIKSHLTEFEYQEIPPLSFKKRQGISFDITNGNQATNVQEMPLRVAVYGLRRLTVFKSSDEYKSQFKTLIDRVVPANLVDKRVEFLNSVVTDGVDLFFCRETEVINQAMASTKGKKLWRSGGYWRKKAYLVDDVEKALFSPD
ncbi:unnamed protein product [Ambrosiozyma monospora]|uniref:Unnamed protein product n=1 Tax=Ambrosiozyma monospora TaxID=43982 RepID=A0ACB5T4Y5_AMBMO|nr:unnamed protein product [Ambrosiozyma monospora]